MLDNLKRSFSHFHNLEPLAHKYIQLRGWFSGIPAGVLLEAPEFPATLQLLVTAKAHWSCGIGSFALTTDSWPNS